MTNRQFRSIRHQTGLSTARFANLLRMGKQAGRTVRRWESGESAIPGCVVLLCDLLRLSAVQEYLGVNYSPPNKPGRVKKLAS